MFAAARMALAIPRKYNLQLVVAKSTISALFSARIVDIRRALLHIAFLLRFPIRPVMLTGT